MGRGVRERERIRVRETGESEREKKVRETLGAPDGEGEEQQGEREPGNIGRWLPIEISTRDNQYLWGNLEAGISRWDVKWLSAR